MKAKLAIWKFASCDGCQLSLLDCEDELLSIADTIDIAHFPEVSRNISDGPYTVSLVEGSITTAEEERRIRRIREDSEIVVTLGACATAGGIQSLKNYRELQSVISQVYAHPDYINTLDTSTPIAEHITVDYELHGCPISKEQLLGVLTALIHGRIPLLPNYSVCEECKRKQTSCIMVTKGTPCMGPVTLAGCGALCPTYQRGCYGCFGPKEQANTAQLVEQFKKLGVDEPGIVRLFRSFNAEAPAFKAVTNPGA